MTVSTDDVVTGVTIEQASSGDETAQRRIYEAYFSGAYRLAYLLLGDAGDAEEVVQDSFVYALSNLWRYDSTRGSFWTWLRVIVVSRARNKRRRRQLALVPLEVLSGRVRSMHDAGQDDPARRLELAASRRAIWDALSRVSPGARDALILRFYEGLPYADISRVLGCSPEAARSRVAHGKSQLRKLLADDAEDLSTCLLPASYEVS
jgi:RNA polymerase sigma-70 factor (ECF subfamily)